MGVIPIATGSIKKKGLGKKGTNRKTTPKTDLPGPSSTTEAPTLNESTTVNAKRTADQPAGGPAAKVANTAQSVEPGLPEGAHGAVSSMATSLPGTGKEMADIGGNEDQTMGYEIERPFSLFENRNNVYKKVHKFMTFGLAPNILNRDVVSGQGVFEEFLTTYLAEIPWHIPALYMNQSEFDLLDIGARVEKVSIDVYYRGTTIQFATASSATNLATLNQINDIAVAHALNKTGQGQNISYTNFDAVETMIPTAIARPKYDAVGTTYRGMVQDYYGTNQPSANFESFIPHHQIGRQTFLYNYWALTSTKGSPTLSAGQFGGWPMLQDKIEQLDGKTMVNQCVLKSEYKPKMGMLKVPLKNTAHGIIVPQSSQQHPLTIAIGGHLAEARTASLQYFGGTGESDAMPQNVSETTQNLGNRNTGANTDPVLNLYTPIEKSQMSRVGMWGEMDPHVQPSIHIGVQPVPALTTTSTLTSSTEDGHWTDVRAYWEVIATMHTKEHDPTAYPYAIQPNVPPGDVVYWIPNAARPAINVDPRNDGATWQGLYTNSFSTVGPEITAGP
uniref:Capsid protein n=1 Tax=Cecropis daurica ambidensovirus TaxID=2794443 RepID=A0A8E7G1X5_9VIRU|nr:MAG: capsid protein [Cecropis daurica ambidensovirus]